MNSKKARYISRRDFMKVAAARSSPRFNILGSAPLLLPALNFSQQVDLTNIGGKVEFGLTHKRHFGIVPLRKSKFLSPVK